MGCRGLANGGPQHGLDDDALIVSTDLLENIRDFSGLSLYISDVSRFIIRPSLEGTLADSLMVCVWMDISLLVFNGLITCIPSGSTSPVTRRKASALHVARTHTGHC